MSYSLIDALAFNVFVSHSLFVSFWGTVLLSDIGVEEAVGQGLSGVRCAIGSANQVRDTLNL